MRYEMEVYMKEEIENLVEGYGISERYAKSLINTAIHMLSTEIIDQAILQMEYHKEVGEFEERNAA